MMIRPESINKLLHPVFFNAEPSSVKMLTKGLAASPGAAVGRVVFDSNRAAELARTEKVILVRCDTSPEDIIGMMASEGILTARGGMTSHAAVVARGMGKPCVCGAISLFISEESRVMEVRKNSSEYCDRSIAKEDKVIIKEGDIISINVSSGEVFLGELQLQKPTMSEYFDRVMQLAKKYKAHDVRVNADTEADCRIALGFDAKGIGLCRTEHMFFQEERIFHIRQMILSDDKNVKSNSFDEIKAFQKKDFIDIFKCMDGLPVTIRLLDPPLHEFLPFTPETTGHFAVESKISLVDLNNKITFLTEKNPMLGHRGCRLAISCPEIYKIQIEAIFEAMIEVERISGGKIKVFPEIMIPLVAFEKECEILIDLIHSVALSILGTDSRSKYLVGSMIELPRACLIADKIAKHVDFLSFGTNDLTQTTLGISRDDMMHFLNDYIDSGIIDQTNDPFVNIDSAVYEMIQIACNRARSTKPNIKIGVCGEHGGSPVSAKLFHKLGLNYISCSPYRIPVAILASAQSSI